MQDDGETILKKEHDGRWWKADERLMFGKLVYHYSFLCVPLYLTSRDSTIVVGGIIASQCQYSAKLSTSYSSNLSKMKKQESIKQAGLNLRLKRQKAAFCFGDRDSKRVRRITKSKQGALI